MNEEELNLDDIARLTGSLLMGKTLVKPSQTFTAVIDENMQNLLVDFLQPIVAGDFEIKNQGFFDETVESFFWELIHLLQDSVEGLENPGSEDND